MRGIVRGRVMGVWRLGMRFGDGKGKGKDKMEIKDGQTQIQQSSQQDQQLTQSSTQTIIPRAYKETPVPGLQQTRKYSNLTTLQQEVIKTNKFDLLSPEIVPKTGSTNSYVGIQEQLTEISLGRVGIKGRDQVFLSQVDPANIPADLEVRFDEVKELKIVGRQTRLKENERDGDQAGQSQSEGQYQMQVQPETIQQKSLKQHMQQQLGIGVQTYKYSNTKNWRRWDIFLSLILFSFFIPFQSTLRELHESYKSTKAIEEERMKEITLMKRRSFQRVLIENGDFNRLV